MELAESEESSGYGQIDGRHEGDWVSWGRVADEAASVEAASE